jgi:taurine dioxygenase
MVSVLHALEVPEGKGDTLFVNNATWLASCSTELQRALASLTAVHSSAAIVRRNNAEGVGNVILSPPPSVTHPVVRSHPVTGAQALYVNEFFTERFSSMSEEESTPLLEKLMAEATQPERVYRHQWQQGDLLVWDNALLMHYAVLDYDAADQRLMHRTTAAAPCSEDTQLPQRPSLAQGSEPPHSAVDAPTLAQLLVDSGGTK